MLIRTIESSRISHIDGVMNETLEEVHRLLMPDDAEGVIDAWREAMSSADREKVINEAINIFSEHPKYGVYGAIGQVAINRLTSMTLDRELELEKELAEQFGKFDLDGHWVAVRKHHLVAADISMDVLRDPQKMPQHVFMPGDNPSKNPVNPSEDPVFRVLPRDTTLFL